MLLVINDALSGEPLTIEVRGINGDAHKNAVAVLAPPRDLIKEGVVDSFWLERFRQQAEKKTKGALEPFGYYHAGVTSRIETAEDGKITMIVEVEPGPPVLVERSEVALRGPGANEKMLQREVGRFPLQKGAILRQDHYDAAKASLRLRAVEMGYLDA